MMKLAIIGHIAYFMLAAGVFSFFELNFLSVVMRSGRHTQFVTHGSLYTVRYTQFVIHSSLYTVRCSV